MAQSRTATLFLDADAPPEGHGPALSALWFAHKSDWERAHALVQNDGSSDAAWVHAHLHRLEGDVANASYWYRRAGQEMPSTDPAEERAAMVEALLGRG